MKLRIQKWHEAIDTHRIHIDLENGQNHFLEIDKTFIIIENIIYFTIIENVIFNFQMTSTILHIYLQYSFNNYY